MIEITGLTHHIGRQEILRDVTLALPRGGVTALIGPNGAGKSTLLSLIARMMPLQAGQISLDGRAMAKTPTDQLARHLCILPQASDIAPRLTVAQLIRFGRYPHSKGRLTEACRAKTDEAIARFDLGPLADRLLDTLSGGQRQRALIAMAYAQDTDYLLLDEPLNNLDITAARHLMRLLREMAAEGKTVLIVLHDINYAATYADRLIVLKDGQIAADGAAREVVTESMLQEVFGADARVTVSDGIPMVHP